MGSAKTLHHLKRMEKRKSKKKELKVYFCFCYFTDDKADEVLQHAEEHKSRCVKCPVEGCRNFIYKAGEEHECVLIEQLPAKEEEDQTRVKKSVGLESAVPWVGAGRFNA